jgi:hypothetical protein
VHPSLGRGLYLRERNSSSHSQLTSLYTVILLSLLYFNLVLYDLIRNLLLIRSKYLCFDVEQAVTSSRRKHERTSLPLEMIRRTSSHHDLINSLKDRRYHKASSSMSATISGVKGKVFGSWNLPNLLSLSRVLMIPIFLLSFVFNHVRVCFSSSEITWLKLTCHMLYR